MPEQYETENREAKEASPEIIARFFGSIEDDELKKGLTYWSPGNLSKIKERFAQIENTEEEIQQLIQMLKNYKLPETRLPLCNDREPFKDLSNATIRESIRVALAYPEKEGRLTDSIREVLNIQPEIPENYLVVEAHLDTTRMDIPLREEAIKLGFETDNFEKIEPPHYRDHYTMRFNIPVGLKERYEELKELMKNRVRDLSYLIQENPETEGYIEAEVYGSKYIADYEYKPISRKGVEDFPFDSKTLINMGLPSTDQEARVKNIDLHSHKAADIHVKTPSGVLGEKYPEAESKPMQILRKKLMAMGFYEVITEAGNKIYTGQFLDIEEARYVFNVLDQYFQKYGGSTQMYIEPCPLFWRKKIRDKNETKLAEIPPVVKLNTSERQKMNHQKNK